VTEQEVEALSEHLHLLQFLAVAVVVDHDDLWRQTPWNAVQQALKQAGSIFVRNDDAVHFCFRFLTYRLQRY